MHLLDPDKKLFDWISFDGVSNVQMAGSLIEQCFPCCTVSTKIQHTVSLLFGKVMAIHPTKEMCGFVKKVSCQVCVFLTLHWLNISFLTLFQFREVFGSVRHAPHSVLRKIRQVHNKGKTLLFIEHSQCRMDGEALQLLKVVWLKDTIMEATMSKVAIHVKSMVPKQVPTNTQ